MATLVGTQERASTRERRREQPSGISLERLGMSPDKLARGLGWFSIGLGLAELIAPRSIARISGTRNHSSLVRSYGLREIAAGVGILATSRPAPWLWARVAGECCDRIGAMPEGPCLRWPR